MKRIMILFIFITTILFTKAQEQNLPVLSIITENGTKDVFQNEYGQFYLVFTREEADAEGLLDGVEDAPDDFISSFAGPGGGFGIKWTIATRKSKCKSGIGFRCGKKYKAYLYYSGQAREGNGRKDDRSYDVWLSTNEDNTIMLTFLDNVDWEWLQQENE